jgi:glycosyltransferase involved in cell wall biosynthesis
MKILLLNWTDGGGGAAIAAFRLFTALKENGIDATLGVVEKKTADNSVVLLSKKASLLYKIFKKLKKLTARFRKNDFITSNPIIHSQNKKSVIDIQSINKSDYDLIHLHWVNNDMISIEDIAKITKPVVWTMHDSWVFCGAEHHPNILEHDTRFEAGYTKKNKPKTTRGKDICRLAWKRKKRAWQNRRFVFISPSNFEKESLQKSALFRNSGVNCAVIPNIIPETIFRPLDKTTVRSVYQIPAHKKVIGFGAAGGISDKTSVKGGYLLLQVLEKLQNNAEDYYLAVFGKADADFIDRVKIPLFAAGFIENPNILAVLYNICDVFICPSIIENLPTTCIESLRCGIPIAAFNTGGVPDIVEHKKTGYLAHCFDTEDLYQGVHYCINNYEELSRNAIKKAERDFDNKSIVNKHIALYNSIVNKG